MVILEEVKTKKISVKSYGAAVKKALLWIAAALAGFCLSAVKIEGEVSPFSAALTAGASNFYVLPSAIGGAAGALVFSEPVSALKYAGSLTLICVLRAAYEKITLKGKELLVYPVMAFFSVLVCSGVISIATGLTLSGLIVIFCEALLSAGCACVSYRLFTLFPGDIRGVAAGAADTAAALIACSVLLLSLDSVRIYGFSPAHFAAFLLVLILSCFAGGAVGCAAGITAGIILGFSPESAYIAYLLPASGLLCGIVSVYGRFASGAGFAVLSALFIIVKGNTDEPFVLILEALLAALAFMLIPKKLMSRIENAVAPFTKEKYALDASLSLGLQLKRSAKAVRDISEYVRAVSRLKEKTSDRTAAIAEGVKSENCAACVKKERCWGDEAESTRAGFIMAAEITEKKELLTKSGLPEYIRTICRKPDELTLSFERKYCEAVAREGAENEIHDIKTLAAAQFDNTASILDDVSNAVEGFTETDPYISALAADAFKEQGFNIKTLLVSAYGGSRALMEVFCRRIPANADYNLILERLRQKTGVRFMLPIADVYKNEGTVLRFCEKTVFSAQFSKTGSPATGEKLCGDTADGFFDGRGNYYLVLSDGMGSGRRAAIDSLLTCSLFSRLMRAGFTPETAIKSVNGALLMRNTDEALSTLDVLKLDLYTGKAEFFKAGASFSVLSKDNKAVIVERSSMPLGIMNEVRFEKSEALLSAGDSVILMSDGASLIPKDFFRELFNNNKNADAQQLARLILKEAENLSPIGRADDITVMCVKLVQ